MKFKDFIHLMRGCTIDYCLFIPSEHLLLGLDEYEGSRYDDYVVHFICRNGSSIQITLLADGELYEA